MYPATHHFLGAVAVLAAGTLTSQGAAAQEGEKPTKVTVLPYASLFSAVPQAQGDKTAELVRAELAAQEMTVVAPSEGKRRRSKRTPGAAEIKAARKEIVAADKLFSRAARDAKRHRLSRAAKRYSQGISKYQLNFQGAENFDALSAAYVQLSIARFKMGDETESVKLLDDVTRVAPALVLEPPAVPPLFARFQKKARKAYLAKGRGQIRVVSTPAGARVTLDGKPHGETPILLTDVVVGEHYLKVEKKGVGAFWKTLEIKAGEELSVSAEIASAPTGPFATVANALGSNNLDATTAKAIQKIGIASGADFVIFGALKKGEDGIDARSWALQTSDAAVTELAELAFDLEMLGAAIEVFKLASDFTEKTSDPEGANVVDSQLLFPGARPPKAEEQFAEAAVSPPEGKETRGRHARRRSDRRRRGPVVAVASRKIEGPESDEAEATPNAIVPRRRRRTRGRIVRPPVAEAATEASADEAAAEEEEEVAEVVDDPAPSTPRSVAEAPAEEELELEIELEAREPEKSKKKNLVEQILAEDEKKEALAAKEEEKSKADDRIEAVAIDARPRNRISGLTPEELEKLREIDDDNSGGGNSRDILIWGGAGVATAGVVGAVIYLLASPTEATSATATISWTP